MADPRSAITVVSWPRKPMIPRKVCAKKIRIYKWTSFGPALTNQKQLWGFMRSSLPVRWIGPPFKLLACMPRNSLGICVQPAPDSFVHTTKLFSHACIVWCGMICAGIFWADSIGTAGQHSSSYWFTFPQKESAIWYTGELDGPVQNGTKCHITVA